MSLTAGRQWQKKKQQQQQNGTIKWLKDASYLNHGCYKLCTKNSFCISKIVKFHSECGGISTQHALPMLCWIAVSSYSNSNNYRGNNYYEMTYDFWPLYWQGPVVWKHILNYNGVKGKENTPFKHHTKTLWKSSLHNAKRRNFQEWTNEVSNNWAQKFIKALIISVCSIIWLKL